MSQREPLPPRGEQVAARRERAGRLLARLDEAYPEAHCALVHDSPWQLLVATILSAQCTDARVNQVTPDLFARFPDAETTAHAELADLERLVQPTGFFRHKAKNVLAAGRRVTEVYGGQVPSSIEQLVTIPGAARKTANVVISNCFPDQAVGIAVDTHVQRIVRRLGLVKAFDPVDIERELVRIIDRARWNDVTHVLIDHGRAICTARSPRCGECPITDLCPSAGRFSSPVAPARGARVGGRSRRA